MKRVENGPMFYPEAKAMVDADEQSQLQAAIAASLEGMDIDVNEAEDWKLRVATQWFEVQCCDGSIFKLIDIYIYTRWTANNTLTFQKTMVWNINFL